jgi:hypothetical protein
VLVIIYSSSQYWFYRVMLFRLVTECLATWFDDLAIRVDCHSALRGIWSVFVLNVLVQHVV